MPIRAISLDVHGTLILPYPSVAAIYAGVAAEHGLTVTAAELEPRFLPAFRAACSGSTVPYGRDETDAFAFWSRVIEGTFAGGVTPALCQALYERFGTGACWRILPRVLELLAALHRTGLPLFICSNFDSRVRRILADLGLDGFAGIFSSAEVGAAKPDPTMLYRIAAAAGCGMQELLHLGDNEREDGGACSAAGCPWLAVDSRLGPDPAAVLARLGRP